MSECMTQEDAERMDASQAVQILKPLRTMMLDRYGCPISDVYFALGKAIEALEQPTVDAVPWEFLERYAYWFCNPVSFPQFIQDAKAFYRSYIADMDGFADGERGV